MKNNKLITGILAGVLITLGGRVYVTVSTLFTPYGKLIGAILFSIGLITILLYKLPLFTGRVGYIQFGSKNSLSDIVVIWIQNLIGCIITGYAIYQISTKEQLDTINIIIESKLSTTFLSTFILAIFCGALMFLAVDGYKRTNQFIIPIICVVVFILSGFEHCIANMGYIVEWGMNQLRTGSLTENNIINILGKLLTTTIGNAIGGIVISKVVK